MTSPSIEQVIQQVAELLPAQGPINIFVHHNTLHSFEGVGFEEALVDAGRKLGCQPFLPEETYRAEFARGRITDDDLRAAIELDPFLGADSLVANLVSRRSLAFAVIRHGIQPLSGPALRWHLEELDALEKFRADAPPEVLEEIAEARGFEDEDAAEGEVVRELWSSCERAALRAPAPEVEPRTDPRTRHRDLLLEITGLDTDDWIHPPLVRFVAAYLDQGLARWPMGDRERGMFAWLLRHYRPPLARLLGGWTRELTLLLDASRPDQSSLGSIEESLRELGVPPEETFPFLLDTALSLRGWAGMVHQLEERPDRAPVVSVPAKLQDFMAVHLLFDRAALTHGIREAGLPSMPLSAVRSHLRERMESPPAATHHERTWPLFQAAQLLGLRPTQLDGLTTEGIRELEDDLRKVDPITCRKFLHLAFERHLQRRFFDSLTHHRVRGALSHPAFQAIFCLDEREESIRRHIEETNSGVATYGTAGFFGIPMYFKGKRDARPRPLAPIAINPKHFVGMETLDEDPRNHGSTSGLQAVHLGGRGILQGVLVSLLGVLALIPLVLRVLFPRLADRFRQESSAGKHRTRLLLHRRDIRPPIGEFHGFTVDEMGAIVHRVLEDAGVLALPLAPIVLVAGHASGSLNNPHRSAYDCGACGGGPGGPGARAFAMMANDSAVRAWLDRRGVSLPEDTWFVGAEHNTTDDGLDLFDTDLVPESKKDPLLALRGILDEALKRNAHERCRRFGNLPHLTPAASLRHVQARRRDLAEPRPEYNHATNAFCIVGRRARTQGLFLDRRCFLVSYDPGLDDPGRGILRRTLDAVIPVVAGINLEYFFGTLDNQGYGAGTKLPHNVSALLGVMNGTASDLRAGLWSQTVEIHEPVRLTLVVESTVAGLDGLICASPMLQRLVQNRWISVAVLDPGSQRLTELRNGRWQEYAAERPPIEVSGPSFLWASHRKGHLPFVEIRAQDVTP